MGRNRKNAKAPSCAKRLRNALKETTAKQQYRAIHPVVRERENAARQELHETERLDPVVRERENATRQELHLDPVVRERENATRRELHLNPVAWPVARPLAWPGLAWPGLAASLAWSILIG
jgi:hypothetical protein